MGRKDASKSNSSAATTNTPSKKAMPDNSKEAKLTPSLAAPSITLLPQANTSAEEDEQTTESEITKHSKIDLGRNSSPEASLDDNVNSEFHNFSAITTLPPALSGEFDFNQSKMKAADDMQRLTIVNFKLLSKAKELSSITKKIAVSPAESMTELDSNIDLIADVEFYTAESEPYLQELSLRKNKILKNLSAATLYPLQHQTLLQENQTFLFDYHFLYANFSIDFPQSFYLAIKFAATLEQTRVLIKLMLANSAAISAEHKKFLEAKHEYFIWQTLEKEEEKKLARQQFESKDSSLDLARQFYLAKLYLESADLSLSDRQDTAAKILRQIIKNDPAADLDNYRGQAYEELACLIQNDPQRIAEWAKLNRLAVEHGIVPARQKLYERREQTEKENSLAFGDIVLETDKIDAHLAHERKAKLKQAADGIKEQNVSRPSHPGACYGYAIRCAEDGEAKEAFCYMHKAVTAKYAPAVQQWTECMSLAALSADLHALIAPTSAYYIKHNSDSDLYGTRKNGIALIRHQQFTELKKLAASLVNPENEEQAIALILNDLVILVGKMLGEQTKPETQRQARSNSFSDQLTDQVMSTLIQYQGSGTRLTGGSKTGKAILNILSKRLPWLFINHQLKPLEGFGSQETQHETFSSKAGSVVSNIASLVWGALPNAITTVLETIILRPNEHEQPAKDSFGYYLERLDRLEVQEICLQSFAEEVKRMAQVDQDKIRNVKPTN